MPKTRKMNRYKKKGGTVTEAAKQVQRNASSVAEDSAKTGTKWWSFPSWGSLFSRKTPSIQNGGRRRKTKKGRTSKRTKKHGRRKRKGRRKI